MAGWAGAGGASGGAAAAGALYVPDCEEVRVSAAVARRGHLNVLQHGTHGWKKRWLVSGPSGRGRAVRARLRGGARVRRRGAPRAPQRAAARHARLEEALAGEWAQRPRARSAAGALYVPDCEEVRVSAAVARRGHLNVLQHGTHGWKKRWLVSGPSGRGRAVRARLRGGARVRRRGAPRAPQRAAARHARLEEALAGEWAQRPRARSAAGALYVPDCEEVRVSAAVARRGHLNVLQHGTHGWKKRWLVSGPSGRGRAVRARLRGAAAGALYVPDCEEVRVSAAVARRGHLNVLQHGTHGWKKRWLVVRRPYVFIYRDERDPVERAVINLANAHVEYSEDQEQMVRMPNTFSVVSKERGYLLQTLGDKEVHDWLYAINPLLAGQIRSRSARRGERAPPPA
ncbi:hypothetical protein ACJJTC_002549 [Scirpophaga incertulas]